VSCFAKRWAIKLEYGQYPEDITVAQKEGRSYELGSEVSPDDIHGRSSPFARQVDMN